MPKQQSNTDRDFKNVRLFVPIDIYNRVKKYQAQRILDDKPELSLAQVCIELLDNGTKDI